MYRILIVDDEKVEREVIHFLLKKFGFELEIMEAANGKEALEKLESCPADILLTDVQMPFVDGMELATKVREKYMGMEIIFFSGHDDFAFVKKALTLRADNYILKPIKPEEFEQTMKKVMDNIRQHKEEQEKREANQEFIKKHILYRLLNQTPIDILQHEYPYLSFDFLNDYKRMILIHSDTAFLENLSEEGTFYLYEQINKAALHARYELIHLNPSQIVLLFKDNSNGLIAYRQVAAQIQQNIHTAYGINCVLSVSKHIENPNHIVQTYSELEDYLKDRFFYADVFIYPIDTPLTDNKEFKEDEYLLREIEKSLQQADTLKLEKEISIIIEKYDKNAKTSQVYLRFLFARLLQLLFQTMPEHSKESMDRYIELIYSYTHFSDIKHTLLEIQRKVIKKLEEDKNSPMHPIEAVKQYVADNIEKDLSLDMLAEKVYLTSGYLSDKFKQETGSGINKYIKQVRMDKADELLSYTNMKVNDISKAVGYSNASYFIRIFREHFGVSPKRYREMKQG
ncbi:response regulator [Oceanobacillus sp. CFH 90083]|uniref:response regulator n=1 Tax=Oceanobacillus sp. CFH 90083 TaxID=2592336 RepID=UPI0018847761|nr:response regulator [Oceanobacillus sp. CFH 90083]